MAQIMARYPLVATRTPVASSAPTYSGGTPIGKMITVTTTPNTSVVDLYGDDEIAESVANPTQGAIALNITTIPNTAAQTMFNVTVTAITPAVTGLVQNNVKYADAEYPFTGFGWIEVELVDGVRIYVVHWLPRVKWQLPANTATTRGAAVQFNTKTINGNYYYDDEYGALEDTFEYSGTGAASAATAKLKELAGITSTQTETTTTT